MWVMAGGAAFAHGVMFENKGAFLSRVAFGAGFCFVFQTRSVAFDGVALVRIVTLGAAHLAGHDGVTVGEAELAALVEMALETRFGRLARVDDRAFAAASGDVLAARTVTAFTAEAFGVFALNHELGVRGAVEVLGGFFVALSAFFFADEGGTRNVRRCYNGAIHHRARDQECGPKCDASENECILGPTTRGFSHFAVGLSSVGRAYTLSQNPECPKLAFITPHLLHRMAQ